MKPTDRRPDDRVQAKCMTESRNSSHRSSIARIAKAPLNNGNRAQRSSETFRARRVAQVMAIVISKRRKRMAAPLLWTFQGPPYGSFQANPQSALPLFDRQPACLQSGALTANLPESLSALPLFEEQYTGHPPQRSPIRRYVRRHNPNLSPWCTCENSVNGAIWHRCTQGHSSTLKQRFA